MERRNPQPKINLTAVEITKILNGRYLSNPKYLINNLYVFGWESDYLAMTRTGYWYEIEIKISKADFKADFKKIEKHEMLSSRIGRIPNCFSYCAPEGLLDRSEIPEYAGFIEIDDKGYMWVRKTPPTLHKCKIFEELNLLDKFYYNYANNLTDRLEKMSSDKELRNRIKVLEQEFKAVAGYEFKESL